ncbi:MAG: phosphotransferase family protein [Acidimicrobiia bacterium]|jgi:aminoglycoside phosphotransferase (APT) family kinase protein
MTEAAEGARPQVSTRDRDELRAQLEAWLTGQRGDATPHVDELQAPESTGMSSDTVLVDVTWSDGERERLVARLAPDANAAPLFPEYDLERQYRTMAEVAARSAVPVPPLCAYESDPAHLGTEFIVMHRVEGLVPPDIPPYAFGVGWIAEATDEERVRLQQGAVGLLAQLHAIADAPAAFPWLARADDRSPLRGHVDEQRAYADWVLDGRDGPLIERGFAWLEEHWPEEEGVTVLSWGDARIGNVIFADFAPAAVLDWEMAGLGPRELDVAWMIYLHRFFDDLARQLDLPGLPDFMRRGDVVATYEELTGYTPRDLDWYTAYAAVRHAIIMTRVGMRQAHFGEAELPADLDELVTHRASLEAMLAGTYWDSVEA